MEPIKNTSNVVIGVGNTGTNIVKMLAKEKLDKIKLFAIDSQVSSVNMNDMCDIKYIPIISDEKNGSGRIRERGKAMYQFHESNGAFDEMYDICECSKGPVIVITSGAGGTGSGSSEPLCRTLVSKGIQVIPIIIFPNMSDPDAYHLNTSDLMVDLGDAGIETYSVFRNLENDSEYKRVNNEIVEQIKIIFGNKYRKTTLDSIDDSDLEVLLSWPGRYMTLSAQASDVDQLKKDLMRKLLSCIQPMWDVNATDDGTRIVGYSLTGPFADDEVNNVFADINEKINHIYDTYKNIVVDDNSGKYEATVIIAGLQRPDIKEIDAEFRETSSISDGINKSKRPKAMTKRKANVSKETDGGTKFTWR